MRAVVQRVSRAQVSVDTAVVGQIERGLCVLVAALQNDTPGDAEFIAHKLASLRIFPDAADRMNLSLTDIAGGVLLISQFTLAADTTSGARPSFSAAMPPQQAQPLLDHLAEVLRAGGLRVEQGSFGARMQVELVNDGPVTLVIDSRARQRK